MCGGRCNGVTAVADGPSDRFRISYSGPLGRVIGQPIKRQTVGATTTGPDGPLPVCVFDHVIVQNCMMSPHCESVLGCHKSDSVCV